MGFNRTADYHNHDVIFQPVDAFVSHARTSISV